LAWLPVSLDRLFYGDRLPAILADEYIHIAPVWKLTDRLTVRAGDAQHAAGAVREGTGRSGSLLDFGKVDVHSALIAELADDIVGHDIVGAAVSAVDYGHAPNCRADR
jgi:hypothetical protein